MSPKRIAILLPDLRGGGVERVRLLLAKEFLDKGFTVDVVLMKAHGDLLQEVPQACRIIELGVNRIRGLWWPLSRYLQREKPMAMLSAMWPMTAVSVLAVKTARVSTNLVLSEHVDMRFTPSLGFANRFLLKFLGRWIYSAANGVVAVSQGVKDSLGAVARLQSRRVTVIYNPIRTVTDLDIPTGDATLIKWWFDGDVRLIAVGSLKSQKDYPTLLHALVRLRSACDARLLLLGEGPERATLEALVDELGLSDAVRLPGFRADPFKYLSKATIFVLSSKYEGFPNVITEALACGLPIVSTDCPSGPAEILKGGQYGKLVVVSDDEALARAIIATVNAPVPTQLLRARAKDFLPSVAGKQYLRLLTGCANKLL